MIPLREKESGERRSLYKILKILDRKKRLLEFKRKKYVFYIHNIGTYGCVVN